MHLIGCVLAMGRSVFVDGGFDPAVLRWLDDIYTQVLRWLME